MLPLVAGAIKRNVTVRGCMHDYTDQPFPKLVHVTSLEIHPCNDELPTLASLRELAPGFTGELSAVDFLRSLRHDERPQAGLLLGRLGVSCLDQ